MVAVAYAEHGDSRVLRYAEDYPQPALRPHHRGCGSSAGTARRPQLSASQLRLPPCAPRLGRGTEAAALFPRTSRTHREQDRRLLGRIAVALEQQPRDVALMF